jgi:hypothetical protein
MGTESVGTVLDAAVTEARNAANLRAAAISLSEGARRTRCPEEVDALAPNAEWHANSAGECAQHVEEALVELHGRGASANMVKTVEAAAAAARAACEVAKIAARDARSAAEMTKARAAEFRALQDFRRMAPAGV